MAVCNSEPDLKEAKVRWIDVLLGFDFDAQGRMITP